jgi:ribosomal protein S24E
MQILEKKEHKLLGRTDVDVLFPESAGALSRRDAVKEVAQSMKVEENRVALLKLASGSGSRDLFGTFRVYNSEADLKNVSPIYLRERLMTKEEREAAKQAKKKASRPPHRRSSRRGPGTRSSSRPCPKHPLRQREPHRLQHPRQRQRRPPHRAPKPRWRRPRYARYARRRSRAPTSRYGSSTRSAARRSSASRRNAHAAARGTSWPSTRTGCHAATAGTRPSP